MEGTMQQVILIFDGDKYDFWRIKIINFKNSRIVDSWRMKTKPTGTNRRNSYNVAIEKSVGRSIITRYDGTTNSSSCCV